MNKLIRYIGIAVLLGILFKLGWVFWFLFKELDKDNVVSQIFGVTFALASVYFVVKIDSKPLKITMVVLDVITILYYYMHNIYEVRIEYVALIIAAYSGLIIYFLGKTITADIDSDSAAIRQREERDSQRTDSERLKIEKEIDACKRRLRQAKTAETQQKHFTRLNELKEKLAKLN